MSFQGSVNQQGQLGQGSFGFVNGQGMQQGSFQLPSVFPQSAGQQGNLQGSFLPGVNVDDQGQQTSGLTAEQWNQLIASRTGPGVNAAQAAVNLDPLYRAQRENQGLQTGYGAVNGDFGQGAGRGEWQALIQQTTQQYGVNAAQAAQMLDPYYQGRGERTANSPGTQSSGGRSRSRSPTRGLQNTQNMQGLTVGGMMGSSPALLQDNGSNNYATLPYYAQQSMQMTPQQLGAQIQNGQLVGLDREGYQVLLSQITGQTGMNAAQAAKFLAPIIRARDERRNLSREQWYQLISQTAQENGVNAAQAAMLLDPYIASPSESGRQYDVTNPSVTVGQNFPLAGMMGSQGNFNGSNQGYNGSQGGSRGRSRSRSGGNQNGMMGGSIMSGGLGSFDDRNKVSEIAGLESGMGRLEGQRGAQSFRAGTPPEANDIVMDINEATAAAAIEASQSPGRVTARSLPENRQYLTAAELQKVARALGLQPGTEAVTNVQAIRNALNQMSAQQQQSFMGSLSPRTQGSVQQLWGQTQ